MKLKISLLSMIAATLLAAGCGGSGGGGSTPEPTPTPAPGPEAPTSTGVLLDSPVAGIQYRTATKSGVTNALGEYEYLEGETVTFFIGDLEFPPVTASGVVTPVDIAAGNGTMQTNILQILQTLDSDGNPDNGITIYEEAATAFAGAKLDLSSEAFDVEVASVLDTIGEGVALVTEDDANAHFEKSQKNQILGSWVYSEGPGKRNVLTFIDESLYIIIHEHSDEPGEPGSQPAGSVEYGNYTWDPSNGHFKATRIDESDGWGGLYDGDSTVTSAAVMNNTLTLTVTDNGGVNVDFTRVPNPVESLAGAYIFTEPKTDSHHVLTFLSDTEYVIAHNQNQESYNGEDVQALSGEFGTYSYDPDTGAFEALNASIDTDGDGGLYDAEEAADQANDTMRFTEKGHIAFSDQDEDEDTVYFTRISGIEAPAPQVPVTFTKEWLQGKTLYPVWYGGGEDALGNEIDDVPVAGKLTFNVDGTYISVGFLNHGNDNGNYTALPSGLLVFDDEPDNGNTIVCGSTSQYIKTHYTKSGVFDNVDLIFFDEAEAMVYAAALEGSIEKCESAKPINYTQSDLTGTWYTVGTATPNNEGSIAANSWADAGTIVIQTDGSYVWKINGEPSEEWEEGILTFLDSEKGTLTDLEANDHLGWFMNAGKDVITLVFNNTKHKEMGTITWVKAAVALPAAPPAYDQTDLNGTWHSVGVGMPTSNALDANYWANAATMTNLPDGTFEWTTEDPAEILTLTLSGTGQITQEGTSENLGWFMSAGKDVMTLVFQDTTDGEQGSFLFVKAAASYTQTDLTGTWHSVGVITPNENGAIADNSGAEAGTMVVESDGAYTWTTNDDEDSGTLSVSVEGVISDTASTDVLGWYLNAGKDVMILVFENTGDNEQGIITFVKQK